MSLRFDGQVAVVTGAGRGLGRLYALFLASRGAKVIVNDWGKSTLGKVQSVANEVVNEIISQGGIAVADIHSVVEGDKIIQTAIDHFGKVDILINNAGIVKVQSMKSAKENEWNQIMQIHCFGAYKCTKAAWEVMRKQEYGRIVNITSTTALYGHAAVIGYATAKSGIIGFTKSLAIEGEKKNIKVNAVAPIANTHMLELSKMPENQIRAMQISYNVPLVAILCHQSCKENGSIFECGGGWFSKVRWQRSEGIRFDPEKMTSQAVAENFSKICSFGGKNEYPVYTPDWSNKVNEWMSKSKL